MRFRLFHRGATRSGGTVDQPAEPPVPSEPPPPSETDDTDRWEPADEIEAFVHGSFAEHRAAKNGFLPAWVILNRVAHGDLAEIHDTAAGLGCTGPPSPSLNFHQVWKGPQRDLARRLLECAQDPDGIRQIQHDVLIPLELSLIARSATEQLTFVQVLAAALEALDHHQLDH
jgi:hypothetical protein